MRRFFRCIPVLVLIASLWSVQGCDTATVAPAAGSREIPETPSGNPGDPAPHTQNPDSGTTTRPDVIVLEINAADTWQSRFIKDSAEIPVNGFKAFYFEDSTPSITAYSERVAFPALSYAYSGPQGIPAQRFNGYWIGRFEFPKDAAWRIDLSQSNSVARILIDKQVIHSGHESRSLIHAFSRGDHIIEIEYKNDWHTLSFSVLFAPVVDGPPPGEIDTAATGAEYWYAAAYQSGKSDLSLDVVLKKSAKPVFLFLSSYEVVRWNILPADSGQVLAVFVDSYQPQSTVTGLGPSVPVTTGKGIPFAYKLLPACQPQLGYCDDPGFGKLVGFMGKEFAISLSGFTGAYSPASLIIPETILDSAKYREIAVQTQALIEGSRLRGLGDVFPGDTSATWQAHFLASEAAIPVGSFQAFYFSDKHPETVIHSEPAAAPAILYSWSDFHHLDANDFAGYWIGKFAFPVPTVLHFGIRQSHAQTAIYVDKQALPVGPGDTVATCSVPAGTHLIEIQHVNNWHTIDFSVTLDSR